MRSPSKEELNTTLLTSVLDRLPVGVVVAEAPSGRVIAVNRQLETILCRPAAFSASLDEYDQWRAVRPDGTAYGGHEWPLARALHGESVACENIRITCGDGAERIVRVCAEPIRDDKSGEVVAAVATCFDVTAESREHEALKLFAGASAILGESLEAEQAVRKITNLSVPRFADLAFVHLLGDDGMLVRHEAAAADPAARQLIDEMWRRFTPSQALIRTVLESGEPQLRSDLGPEVFRSVADAELRGMLEALGIRSAVAVPIRASGVTIGIMSFAMTSSGRKYDRSDLMVAEEIGRRAGAAIEKTRLFAAEKSARQEAERASRAKDEFLAVLSHELRTPMTTVIGWADFLKMTRGDDPNLAAPIEGLRTSARVQAKLVDDLLDVSRVVTGKLGVRRVETELTGIIRNAVTSIQLSAQDKDLHVVTQIPSHRIPIFGDPERLLQIVTNLLVNAVKFTPSGGRIKVMIVERQDEADIVVEDSGEGICADFLPHVFDRFQQGSSGDSRRHAGLGLGLSLVQHLTQLHGGHVRAESDGPGKGARFTVTLPLQLAGAPEPAKAL